MVSRVSFSFFLQAASLTLLAEDPHSSLAGADQQDNERLLLKDESLFARSPGLSFGAAVSSRRTAWLRGDPWLPWCRHSSRTCCLILLTWLTWRQGDLDPRDHEWPLDLCSASLNSETNCDLKSSLLFFSLRYSGRSSSLDCERYKPGGLIHKLFGWDCMGNRSRQCPSSYLIPPDTRVGLVRYEYQCRNSVSTQWIPSR